MTTSTYSTKPASTLTKGNIISVGTYNLEWWTIRSITTTPEGNLSLTFTNFPATILLHPEHKVSVR